MQSGCSICIAFQIRETFSFRDFFKGLLLWTGPWLSRGGGALLLGFNRRVKIKVSFGELLFWMIGKAFHLHSTVLTICYHINNLVKCNLIDTLFLYILTRFSFLKDSSLPWINLIKSFFLAISSVGWSVWLQLGMSFSDVDTDELLLSDSLKVPAGSLSWSCP